MISSLAHVAETQELSGSKGFDAVSAAAALITPQLLCLCAKVKCQSVCLGRYGTVYLLCKVVSGMEAVNERCNMQAGRYIHMPNIAARLLRDASNALPTWQLS